MIKRSFRSRIERGRDKGKIRRSRAGIASERFAAASVKLNALPKVNGLRRTQTKLKIEVAICIAARFNIGQPSQ